MEPTLDPRLSEEQLTEPTLVRKALNVALAVAVWFALVVLLAAASGCATSNPQMVLPTAAEGDCYMADRDVAVSPMMGASATLHGNLVKKGCIELIKAITEARKAGVDTRDMERLLR